MALWMYQAMTMLGQAIPTPAWDYTAPSEQPGTQETKPLSFGDLQQSFKAQFNGETDDTFYRNALIGLVVAVVIMAVVLHWRQKKKAGGPPSSMGRLGWELSRGVKFPFGTRVLLWWVAKTTGVPLAVLLISSESFESSVGEWAGRPTFALVREWGAGRLERLHEVLFGGGVEAGGLAG